MEGMEKVGCILHIRCNLTRYVSMVVLYWETTHPAINFVPSYVTAIYEWPISAIRSKVLLPVALGYSPDELLATPPA